MISIFDYQQYREFLRDIYLDQKKRKTGLTYARFSSTAGINSPNYLKLVMDGEKNLTSETLVKFAKALKLTPNEADYFEALVHFNQAKTALEREHYQERMGRIKKRAAAISTQERTLDEYEFESVSNWLHHAVMVLTHVRDFRESPRWIKARLFDVTSEQEISSILERLVQIRLLKRDETGKLVQSQRQIRTKPELKRLSSRIFYEGLLARAIQALKVSEPEEREFGTYLVGMSAEQMPELKKRVREFLTSLNEWALSNPNPEQVYSLTFCGFPLSASDQTVISAEVSK